MTAAAAGESSAGVLAKDTLAPGTLSLEDAGDSRCRLRGSLTFATATAAHALGLSRIAALAANVEHEFDCSGISEADSAGLAVLIEWKAAAGKRGATLRYSSLPESIARLARISDVERLLSER